MALPANNHPNFIAKHDDIGIVAAGFSGGQRRLGVSAAPSAMIEAGLLEEVHNDLGYNIHHDHTVHSYTDLYPTSDPDHRGMKKPRAVSAAMEKLSQQVCVLTLGGDHSVAIGTLSGTARAIRKRHGREMAVIYVDAHGDINTPETSGSGNIHGMPVAFVSGLAKGDSKDIFGWIKDEHLINVDKLVYIGLRDVGASEKKTFQENEIKVFSMHDVNRLGIGRVMELALAYIGNTPIHLSYDIDALDPEWAPSTGFPVPGGLSLCEGVFIAECIRDTGNLIAMDLVEVNPQLEVRGAERTIQSGFALIRSALGNRSI
ncbi:putative arginase [Xylona heveae TC161]|uniref:Arginase n=1 Tax=Xylona heveae (strain CBS 132557 / TC161) TaxID=1328760 RepID=A0A164ZCH5_XYLHT|nr:putative arginase [Xylona heveae TC161]KZF18933.1 putative arginase [Xylona heveae TC161]